MCIIAFFTLNYLKAQKSEIKRKQLVELLDLQNNLKEDGSNKDRHISEAGNANWNGTMSCGTNEM